jgi:Tol biopolymer transport system component
VIGGQNVNVKLTSTNVVYDSVAQTLSADVTVQNLMVQRMGSDGVTVSGLKVFFASGPNTTSGSGLVEVANADGYGLFTGSAQPYFYYAGALAGQAVTAPRRWTFSVPRSVGTFSFTVFVSTSLVPTIVFEMWPGGNRDLYRMGIDGNDLVRLTTSDLTDASPTVARGTVVFTSYRDGNAELYSMPLAGGAQTRLTSTPTFSETAPALSPDGNRLAWAGGPTGGITKIYVGKPDATGSYAAVSGGGDAIESTPSWADSTTLAFGTTAGTSSDIFRVIPGGTASLLAGGQFAEVEPAWSPDGTRVAFASNRSGDTELYLLTLGTGTVTRLTTRTGSDGAPTWLANGHIAFTCVQGTQWRLCEVDPAVPGTVSVIPTPGQADHVAGVR